MANSTPTSLTDRVMAILEKSDRPLLTRDIWRKVKGATMKDVSGTLGQLKAAGRLESRHTKGFPGSMEWSTPGRYIPPSHLICNKWDRSLQFCDMGSRQAGAD